MEPVSSGVKHLMELHEPPRERAQAHSGTPRRQPGVFTHSARGRCGAAGAKRPRPQLQLAAHQHFGPQHGPYSLSLALVAGRASDSGEFPGCLLEIPGLKPPRGEREGCSWQTRPQGAPRRAGRCHPLGGLVCESFCKSCQADSAQYSRQDAYLTQD